MAAQHNGNFISVTDEPPSIALWNVESATAKANHEWSIDEKIVDAHVNSDGTKVAAISRRFADDEQSTGCQLHIWNTDDPNSSQVISIEDARAVAIRFIKDSSQLLLAGSGMSEYSGKILVYDVDSLKRLYENETNRGPWMSLEAYDDDKRFLIGNQFNYLSLRSLVTYEELASVAFEARPQHIVSNSSGSRIAVLLENERLLLLQNDLLLLKRSPQDVAVLSVDMNAESSTVYCGTRDGDVLAWESPNIGRIQRESRFAKDSVGIQFVRIPAGKFVMGTDASTWIDMGGGRKSPMPYETPPHPVEISSDFEMARFETTVGQFKVFVDSTGYQTASEQPGKKGDFFTPFGRAQSHTGFSWRNPGFPQSEDHPVTFVTYQDAIAFCQWMTEKEGRKYRLPTEAEWEYACRAGTTTAWSFGDHNFMGVYGNIRSQRSQFDSFQFTAPVGRFHQNLFGLYDMYGNVEEWCLDWYRYDHYSYANASNSTDPQGASETDKRVQRGGTYHNIAYAARSAFRGAGDPQMSQSCLGFRVVREIKE